VDGIIVGEVRELYRYPVKSFQGEKIAASAVESYGFYGDRARYFVDQSRGDKHLSAKQVPGLLGYRARYVGGESAAADGGGFPEIEVITPDGQEVAWDEPLWQEVGRMARRPLSARTFSPETEDLAAVDDAHILLATDASLREVGAEADIRRFRPNIVLNAGDMPPFGEFAWVGCTLRIGDEVELHVTHLCERCSMVNIDPERLTVETKYLKKLGESHDACFGIYAKVMRTGTVSVGDKVALAE